jgi:hypothetical protein
MNGLLQAARQVISSFSGFPQRRLTLLCAIAVPLQNTTHNAAHVASA